MEDINDQEFGKEKKTTSYDTEDVSDFKDAVINPTKQEMENKFSGMKELFTSILAENRKDYEKQISEMKSLFTSILDDNRKQFQVQLQDMYKSLPEIINEADRMRRQEEYVFLNSEEGAERGNKGGKFTKMSAVKELIAGKDAKFLEQSIKNLEEDIELVVRQDKENLAETAKEIYERLNTMELRINNELEKVYKSLEKDMQNHSDVLANKKETYKTVRGVVEYLRNID